MTTEHFIIFVGAGPALSSELTKIQKRVQGATVICPAMGKKKTGVNAISVAKALEGLHQELSDGRSCEETARMTVWFYEPQEPGEFETVWSKFGHSAWVEVVPREYVDKVLQTREFIEKRINGILPLLHTVSGATYAQRKSAPLTIPLRNFKSKLTKDLKKYWYNELNEAQLKKKIKSFKHRYFELKSNEHEGFVDEGSLVFSPAKDEALHGIAHPTGATAKSFACGRFRYGVALFPGFHFEVSATKSPTIQRELRDSDGSTRLIKSENRTYINIFPNDHLLPKK
ncbi:hypothetical protein RSK20926_02142 [Roseobacter sp. SK209-2-6]|uniref:hypothetical protein n=1 Tax=Roseobacter sp. SK209-2-6 TaxID=388739 RepID=UPI0000F3E401|nr:hypothetical protein [Roseobacter sp. SK209-2-6]EBA14431.1 hypothetical protein RSK20926_02142 [Roseobacter sp. SK209-2-6]